MSDKGIAFDNIMIERLWHTIKYKEVYLKEYKHSSLGNRTPKEAYLSGKNKVENAA